MLKATLSLVGLFAGGWGALQAALIVLPQIGVELNELCLLSTLFLVLGALAGAALAVAFTEVAIVAAGCIAGGMLGWVKMLIFIEMVGFCIEMVLSLY